MLYIIVGAAFSRQADAAFDPLFPTPPFPKAALSVVLSGCCAFSFTIPSYHGDDQRGAPLWETPCGCRTTMGIVQRIGFIEREQPPGDVNLEKKEIFAKR
ncbi:hypothetical protein NPIL_615051 [Nephila pilipes]|uniref:Uncharacterized protein n=1 Tax=Nephila pilipes TaxID=299642 RepID=A0A8X6Q6P1_NEPPI|nr:hypothetical protein NPIL_615051 [Nephila pilipes]